MSNFAVELEMLIVKWRKLGDDLGDMRNALLDEAKHLATLLAAQTSAK